MSRHPPTSNAPRCGLALADEIGEIGDLVGGTRSRQTPERHMRHQVIAMVFALALTFAACESADAGTAAGGGGGGGGGAGAPPAGPSASEREAAIRMGFDAPSEAHDAGDAGVMLTLEAVATASVAAGGLELITTGTLTQTGGSFQYAATPTDRLVIAWSDATTTELFISQLSGDLEAETSEDFLSGDHAVTTRVVRADVADFTVVTQKSGGTRDGSIVGMVAVEGVAYQVDLQETGTTTSEVDAGAVDYESESSMTGTITAPGFSLIAQESYWFHSVVFERAIVNRSRTADSVWTFNGDEYRLDGLYIRTATTDSWPDDDDYWRAEGAVTENGVVVGQVTLEEDALSIDVVLSLQGGGAIELDHFLKEQ
jgi:hypothetical protein